MGCMDLPGKTEKNSAAGEISVGGDRNGRNHVGGGLEGWEAI